MNIPVEVMEGSAEAITFADNTFDSVVVGYSLCTIPDPIKALKEIKRVLKSNVSYFLPSTVFLQKNQCADGNTELILFGVNWQGLQYKS